VAEDAFREERAYIQTMWDRIMLDKPGPS